MSVDTSDGHPAMDYTEHQRTFAGFMTGAKISIVAIIAVLIGMVVFLV